MAEREGFTFRYPAESRFARSVAHPALSSFLFSPLTNLLEPHSLVLANCSSSQPPSFTPKRPTLRVSRFGVWRRERDSNPRRPFDLTRFRGVLLQPLGHLSAYRNQNFEQWIKGQVDGPHHNLTCLLLTGLYGISISTSKCSNFGIWQIVPEG